MAAEGLQVAALDAVKRACIGPAGLGGEGRNVDVEQVKQVTALWTRIVVPVRLAAVEAAGWLTGAAPVTMMGHGSVSSRIVVFRSGTVTLAALVADHGQQRRAPG